MNRYHVSRIEYQKETSEPNHMKYRYQLTALVENEKRSVDFNALSDEKKQQFGRLLEEQAMKAAGYDKIKE